MSLLTSREAGKQQILGVTQKMGRKNSDCSKGGGVAAEVRPPSSVTDIDVRQLVPWL